jgi:predicted dehydrogenase
VEKPIRWGILGTGKIAQYFTEDLSLEPDAELIAVGSRSMESANRFGESFRIPHRHPSYEALAADPQVDVIYVSTPNHLHHENSLLCLKNDKAVLCEKPFAINALEAADVIEEARKKNLFLMEAMWSRNLPLYIRLREMLQEEVIGEVRMLAADFGFKGAYDPEGRLLNLELGGGALLDVGIYPLSLASMIFGSPQRITGLAHLGDTGVDEQAGVILGYSEGQLAMLYTVVRLDTPIEALIMGTHGQIKIHPPMHHPERLTLSLPGKPDQVIDLPLKGNGLHYQAGEVMRCLREGRQESNIMPLDETLSIMKTMDEIRNQWGLRYPME